YIAHRWHFDQSAQRLELPAFIRAHFKDLTGVEEIKISLFLVDFNFGKLEFERYLLDEKAILLQEENPGWDLFPTSIVSVSCTAVFYVGVDLVMGVEDKRKVLGMRAV